MPPPRDAVAELPIFVVAHQDRCAPWAPAACAALAQLSATCQHVLRGHPCTIKTQVWARLSMC